MLGHIWTVIVPLLWPPSGNMVTLIQGGENWPVGTQAIQTQWIYGK